MTGIAVTELTVAEIRATILDMRLCALADRVRAKNLGPSPGAHAYLSNAILNEHWAVRLEATLPPV